MPGFWRQFAVCVFLLISLSGCNQARLFDLFIPHVQSKTGQEYFDDLRRGDIAPVAAKTDRQYFGNDASPILTKVAGLFPKEEPKSIKVVGSNTLKGQGFTRYAVTYEYEFTKLWILAQIVMEERNGKLAIIGLHIQRRPQSLEQVNAFALTGKPIAFYSVLALALLIGAFTLATAAVAIFTYIPRLKWLWIIFILLGIGKFELNWVTGQYGISFLALVLFGAGFFKYLYGPTIISLGFPLGAIVFWARRGAWKRNRRTDSADIRQDG